MSIDGRIALSIGWLVRVLPQVVHSSQPELLILCRYPLRQDNVLRICISDTLLTGVVLRTRAGVGFYVADLVLAMLLWTLKFAGDDGVWSFDDLFWEVLEFAGLVRGFIEKDLWIPNTCQEGA